MRRVFLASVFLFLAAPLWAEDLYVAQNAAGAGTGVDCANALPASFFNLAANWGAGAGKISAGDTVHLCGTFTTALAAQGSGASGSPITIVYEPGAKHSSAAGWGASGALSATGKSFLIFDGGTNGLIEATANGTALATQLQSEGVVLSSTNDCEVKNLTISNLYVRTALSADFRAFGRGIEMQGGNRNLIHDNHVNDAFFGIYTWAQATITGTKIYNNTITNVSTGVVHGSGGIGAIMQNAEIYGNEINYTTVWQGSWPTGAADPCRPSSCGDGHHHLDGIHVWAVHASTSLTNLKIYSNYIHGDVGTGNMTAPIYVECNPGTCANALNYNNLLVVTVGGPAAGFIDYKGAGATNTQIYNNTSVGSGAGNCFYNDRGTGMIIKNNICSGIPTGISLTDVSTTLAASDFNVFFGLGGNQMYCQTGFKTFANWRSVGCGGVGSPDANSLTSDPLLNVNFRPSPLSPAVNRGVDLSAFFTVDKRGIARPQGAAWDVGCFELAKPNPPTNLKSP